MSSTTTRLQRRGAVIAAALCAGVLMLSACATPASTDGTPEPSSPAGSSSASSATDIVGTWVLDKEFATAPNTPFLTIREDGDWVGSDGCNGGGGTWQIADDGVLTTTSGAMTLIGCDGAALPTLFATAASAERVGDELNLTGTDGTETTLIVGESDLSTTK